MKLKAERVRNTSKWTALTYDRFGWSQSLNMSTEAMDNEIPYVRQRNENVARNKQRLGQIFGPDLPGVQAFPRSHKQRTVRSIVTCTREDPVITRRYTRQAIAEPVVEAGTGLSSSSDSSEESVSMSDIDGNYDDELVEGAENSDSEAGDTQVKSKKARTDGARADSPGQPRHTEPGQSEAAKITKFFIEDCNLSPCSGARYAAAAANVKYKHESLTAGCASDVYRIEFFTAPPIGMNQGEAIQVLQRMTINKTLLSQQKQPVSNSADPCSTAAAAGKRRKRKGEACENTENPTGLIQQYVLQRYDPKLFAAQWVKKYKEGVDGDKGIDEFTRELVAKFPNTKTAAGYSQQILKRYHKLREGEKDVSKYKGGGYVQYVRKQQAPAAHDIDSDVKRCKDALKAATKAYHKAAASVATATQAKEDKAKAAEVDPNSKSAELELAEAKNKLTQAMQEFAAADQSKQLAQQKLDKCRTVPNKDPAAPTEEEQQGSEPPADDDASAEYQQLCAAYKGVQNYDCSGSHQQHLWVELNDFTGLVKQLEKAGKDVPAEYKQDQPTPVNSIINSCNVVLCGLLPGEATATALCVAKPWRAIPILESKAPKTASFVIKAVLPALMPGGSFHKKQLRHVTGTDVPLQQASKMCSIGGTVDLWPMGGVLGCDPRTGKVAVLVMEEFLNSPSKGAASSSRALPPRPSRHNAKR